MAPKRKSTEPTSPPAAAAAAAGAGAGVGAAAAAAGAAKEPELPAENAVFDYIVIGGGTASCVVAGRLSENPRCRVLLLERGIDVTNDPTVKPTRYQLEVPLVPQPFTPVETFIVGPDPNLLAQKGFNLEYAAKAWGGGPAVSGSFWGRGDPTNYDEWVTLGCPGWSYDACLPFFKVSEHFFFPFNPQFPISPDRGQKGPVGAGALNIDDPNSKPFLPPFCDTFQCPVITDSSTKKGQFGVSPMVRSLGLDVNKPVRNSTYVCYVKPFLASRPNLTAVSSAYVTRIVFDRRGGPNAKPRAVGVEYLVNGVWRTARCRCEVILGAGTVNTPKILMHSGVGDQLELAKWGIPLVKHMPGVGKNLTNHMFVSFAAQISPKTIPKPLPEGNGANIGFLRSANFPAALTAAAKAHVGGAAAAGVAGAAKPVAAAAAAGAAAAPAPAAAAAAAAPKAGDAKREGVSAPPPPAAPIDIELSWAVAPTPTASTPNSIIGFVADLRNQFRGVVSLTSSDPIDQARVTYFTPSASGLPTLGLNPQSPDITKLYTTMRLIRAWLFDTGLCSPMAPENLPSAATVPLDGSDAAWQQWIMSQICGLYHWGGTTKMGAATDPSAVVDARLRVLGVDGLRICDCSVFPLIVSTHPSATAVMVGERLAFQLQGWSKFADPSVTPPPKEKDTEPLLPPLTDAQIADCIAATPSSYASPTKKAKTG